MLPDVRSTLPHNWLWQKWLAVYMALLVPWQQTSRPSIPKNLVRSHVERRTAELHHSLHEEQPQFPCLCGWPQRTEPWGNEGYRASDRPRSWLFFRPEIFGSGNGHHQKKERTSLFSQMFYIVISYQFIGIYIYIRPTYAMRMKNDIYI